MPKEILDLLQVGDFLFYNLHYCFKQAKEFIGFSGPIPLNG